MNGLALRIRKVIRLLLVCWRGSGRGWILKSNHETVCNNKLYSHYSPRLYSFWSLGYNADRATIPWYCCWLWYWLVVDCWYWTRMYIHSLGRHTLRIDAALYLIPSFSYMLHIFQPVSSYTILLVYCR